jgi:hypothetical protein
MQMTERELRAVAEAIKEQLPSFSVGINNPNDVSNAKYAQAISEASAQAAISASDSKYVRGLVEALKLHAVYMGSGFPVNGAARTLQNLPEDLRYIGE